MQNEGRRREREARDLLAFIARLVRGARAAEGLTVRDLGRRLGVSAATVSRIEHGRIPDAVTFLRLVDWLRHEARATSQETP